jgi:hypothetical protein
MPGIRHTINMGNKCYYGLKNRSPSRQFQKDNRCKIHKILIIHIPVVLGGRESWTLMKDDERKLNIFESF